LRKLPTTRPSSRPGKRMTVGQLFSKVMISNLKKPAQAV